MWDSLLSTGYSDFDRGVHEERLGLEGDEKMIRRKRIEATVLIGMLLVGVIGMNIVSTAIASGQATATQPVHSSKLIEFLPAAPFGWVLSGTVEIPGGRWSGVEGWYLKSGTKDVIAYVLISDSYRNYYSTFSELQDFESTEGYGKKVAVKRFPAYESCAKYGNSSSYGLYVIINDRFMVEIETYDRDTLYNLANAIDYNGIAALGTGTEPTTENHPPTAIRIEPVSEEVSINVGDTITFKVKAEDEDEDVHNNLKMIKWFIGDEAHSPEEIRTNPADGTNEEASFSYTFENRGAFSVKATVYDEQMEEDSVAWAVNIGQVPGRYTLKFEGYDFDMASEVRMFIKDEGIVKCFPSNDDPSANEDWNDYSIDITKYVKSGSNILGFDLQRTDGAKVQNVRIFKNDKLIYAFNPITPMKLYIDEYLLYEFNTAETPINIDWAGPITIEMYAPKEIEKGGGYTIRIIVKLPRSGEHLVIHQHGKIGICYSEKVDIAFEPVLQLRRPNWDWNTFETFKLKKDCDLFGAAIDGVVGKLLGKYNPGAGVGLSVIKEAHKCEVGYAHGGPPASEEWKDINEYDIYECVYDVGYCGLVGLDRINAFYPLKFNEAGEYKISAFVDLIYRYELPSQNKRVGKELVWTVKVVDEKEQSELTNEKTKVSIEREEGIP